MSIATQNKETALKLARYMGVPLRMHHVTVHSNGRCFLRVGTVQRMGLCKDCHKKVTVIIMDGVAVMSFSSEGTSRLMNPSANCSSLYFYCKPLSSLAASSHISRLRISHFIRNKDGSIDAFLSLSAVKDIYYLINKK